MGGCAGTVEVRYYCGILRIYCGNTVVEYCGGTVGNCGELWATVGGGHLILWGLWRICGNTVVENGELWGCCGDTYCGGAVGYCCMGW